MPPHRLHNPKLCVNLSLEFHQTVCGAFAVCCHSSISVFSDFRSCSSRKQFQRYTKQEYFRLRCALEFTFLRRLKQNCLDILSFIQIFVSAVCHSQNGSSHSFSHSDDFESDLCLLLLGDFCRPNSQFSKPPQLKTKGFHVFSLNLLRRGKGMKAAKIVVQSTLHLKKQMPSRHIQIVSNASTSTFDTHETFKCIHILLLRLTMWTHSTLANWTKSMAKDFSEILIHFVLWILPFTSHAFVLFDCGSICVVWRVEKCSPT